MDEIRYDHGDDPVEVARKIVHQYGLRTCVTGDRVEAVISGVGSLLMLPGSRLIRRSDDEFWAYDFAGPAAMVPTNPLQDGSRPETLREAMQEYQIGDWIWDFIEAGQRLCDKSGCGDCCDAAIEAERARVAFKTLREDYEAWLMKPLRKAPNSPQEATDRVETTKELTERVMALLDEARALLDEIEDRCGEVPR